MEHELGRFIEAQKNSYDNALSEIKSGRKRSHWMWYVFPQLEGLGFSDFSILYGIKSLPEAKAYMEHPVLGARLLEISNVLLALNESDAYAVLGRPDVKKLKSCMTLFDFIAPEHEVFSKVLYQYFDGERDEKTLAIISRLIAS